MMMMQLSLKASRSELLWALALSTAIAGGLGATALAFASMFSGHQPCNADLVGAGCAGLSEALRPWYSVQQLLVGLLWILPTAVGALLGVMITARELERRSAHISWAISTSRGRWLLLRVVAPAVILVALFSLCAGAAELVTRARLVTDQPGFIDYELRSVLVPLRGFLAFAIGIAIGAQVGRSLPALIVAIAMAGAVTVGLSILMDTWQAAFAVFVPLEELSGTQYPLPVFPTQLEWPEGRGLMVIPVADFAHWIGFEALLYVVAISAWLLVAHASVRDRSPR